MPDLAASRPHRPPPRSPTRIPAPRHTDPALPTAGPSPTTEKVERARKRNLQFVWRLPPHCVGPVPTGRHARLQIRRVGASNCLLSGISRGNSAAKRRQRAAVGVSPRSREPTKTKPRSGGSRVLDKTSAAASRLNADSVSIIIEWPVVSSRQSEPHAGPPRKYDSA